MHTPPTPASPAEIRLLCVEDNPEDVQRIADVLQRADPARRYAMHRVETATAFQAAIAQDYDVILCDFNLPSFSPYAALQILMATGCESPLVVLTRAIGEDAAVHVLRCGAKDYLTKDKLGTLPQIIDRVMTERRNAVEKKRLGAELQAAYERLRALSSRIVLAQERERSLISRELHDQLGQSLTALLLHLRAARRAPDAQAFEKHTATAEELANSTLQQIKTLSFSLRPAQLDLLGLQAAVTSAVQRIAEPACLSHVVTARGEEPRELRENAAVVVRLVQEALNNTVRHARASRLWVRLRFLAGGRIGLLVVDDGVGFRRDSVLRGGRSEHNVGLYGMIERTELVGGRLHIRAVPGRGVALRAVL
jgi:signal transduction histidine kinase